LYTVVEILGPLSINEKIKLMDLQFRIRA
jgi:hypothetical protein